MSSKAATGAGSCFFGLLIIFKIQRFYFLLLYYQGTLLAAAASACLEFSNNRQESVCLFTVYSLSFAFATSDGFIPFLVCLRAGLLLSMDQGAK